MLLSDKKGKILARKKKVVPQSGNCSQYVKSRSNSDDKLTLSRILNLESFSYKGNAYNAECLDASNLYKNTGCFLQVPPKKY